MRMQDSGSSRGCKTRRSRHETCDTIGVLIQAASFACLSSSVGSLRASAMQEQNVADFASHLHKTNGVVRTQSRSNGPREASKRRLQPSTQRPASCGSAVSAQYPCSRPILLLKIDLFWDNQGHIMAQTTAISVLASRRRD